MFENIIGQTPTITGIRSEIAADRFPRAVLFHGPHYSGKLSAALEVGRALTCELGTAEWSCECRSCGFNRVLTYPYLLLMGPRYFEVEIAACADVLRRTKKLSSQYLFVRAVRKLTRRFDTVLWGTEETRVRRLQDQIAVIEDELGRISPGESLPDDEDIVKTMDKIVSRCKKITPAISPDNIPVSFVRRVSYWSHLSAPGARKIVIIENADRMQESSRNSLLKLLEEPPEGTTLILLTAKRSALIPTVVSRLRPYVFFDRGMPETRQILERIFAEEPDSYGTLREYFIAWRDLNPTVLRTHAVRFTELAVDAEGSSIDIASEMSEVLAAGSSRDNLVSFFEELLIVFEGVLTGDSDVGGDIALETLEAWTDAVREQHLGLKLYNLNPTGVLENLFARMKETA